MPTEGAYKDYIQGNLEAGGSVLCKEDWELLQLCLKCRDLVAEHLGGAIASRAWLENELTQALWRGDRWAVIHDIVSETEEALKTYPGTIPRETRHKLRPLLRKLRQMGE